MARKQRPNMTMWTGTVNCGATDQNNKLVCFFPSKNAVLLQASFETVTAGTGTGTFSVQIKTGSTNFLTDATATTFIDADAAADTFHGAVDGRPSVIGVEGERLGLTTVKSGTVSADATLLVQLLWQL